MKKPTIRKAIHRGFTLIELMIVIVILGVLMGTILPRLTGAQARARDTGRVADLNSISQALETYYDDFGEYPGTAATVECLNEAGTRDLLADYLKGGVPTPPSTEQVTTLLGESCSGAYLYAPLNNRGLEKNGYILASDVETYQNANFDGSSITSIDSDTAVGDFVTVEGTSLQDADDEAQDTIFILFN